jgi:hypothetical protein
MSHRDDDDRAFIRQYAVEIASALRAQEEEEGCGVVPSVEDSTRELYRALCFDEPVVETIPHLATAASALCRQLTNHHRSSSSSSDYALSNRLVNGIVYLCRRGGQPSSPITPTAQAGGGNDTSSSPVRSATTTSLLLAKLAFCVLVQVPLECFQVLLRSSSKDVSMLQRFLGSYQGSVVERRRSEPLIMEPTSTTTTDDKVTQLAHALTSGGTGEDDLDDDDHDDDDAHPTSGLTVVPTQGNTSSRYDEEEVWAADSDPSDYDYDEGEAEDHGSTPLSPISLAAAATAAVDFVDLLDPIVLSTPDPQRSLEDARSAIGSLVQQANYSILAPIFQMPKKQVEAYTHQLTQLLLLILQPPHSILSSPHCDDNQDSSSSLQNVMLTPLWILRDVALHHPSSHDQSSYSGAAMYLEVIQTLLAIDQAYQSDTTTTTKIPLHKHFSSNPLCSASIVGLSALSSWCCSAQIPIPVTMTAIVDAMNDVAYVMERAVETGYRKHLQHSIPPIIDILIGMTFFDNRNSSGGLTGGGGTMVCQTLLNSGLLRQLLSLSLNNHHHHHHGGAGEDDDESPPYHLDHALWGLCVRYPTVVGKYVARYPGFPSIVRRYHPSSTTRSAGAARDCVQSILWNSLAYSHHCCGVDGSTTPQMVWKSRSSKNGVMVAPPIPLLTQDECREVCQKSWTNLCTMVQAALLDSHDSSTTSPQQSLDVVKEWERLLIFISIPSVAPTFQSLIMTDCDDLLSGILGDLTMATGVPNAQTSNGRTPKEKRDGDDEEDPKKSSMSHQELIVATTRKTLKQYTLFFQGNTRGSSKTD